MTHAPLVNRLKEAPWLLSASTQRVYSLLEGENRRVRAVGGVVRDTLLGRARDGAEIDFATEFLPQEVMARAGEAGIHAFPTGIEHGTVSLEIEGQLFEITTLRQDIETDGRHATVQFGTDWRRDAERRDFTMNALYADMDGTLFDPLEGLGDCLAGKVRFIGDPGVRIAEDRLRVYRFFRFTASHGDQAFDPIGLDACKKAAGDLSGISAERIGVEMMRMFELKHIAKTVRTMVRAKILNFNRAAQRQLALYDTRTDVPLAAGRLALIMGPHGAKELQAMWRLSNAEIKAATALRDAAILLGSGQINEVAYRFADVAKTAVAVAAALHDWATDWQDEVSSILRATRVPAFPIKGQDLIDAGLKAGPALGRKLHTLERDWIDSAFQLNREELLRRATI